MRRLAMVSAGLEDGVAGRCAFSDSGKSLRHDPHLPRLGLLDGAGGWGAPGAGKVHPDWWFRFEENMWFGGDS